MLVALCVVLLGAATAPALAGTWTIQGPIVNNSGSSDPSSCPSEPPGLAGCVWNQTIVDDDASFNNGNQFGGVPEYVLPGEQNQNILFWAPYLDEGADVWSQTLGPDGSTFVLTMRDDIAVEDNRGGRFSGCGEPQPQAPQYVCTPAWSGGDAAPTVGFTFGPSAQAPVASAGQTCTSTTASDSNRTDCTLGSASGNISPIVLSGDNIVDIRLQSLTQTPTDISFGNSGYGDGDCTAGPPPDSYVCDMHENDLDDVDIEIWPANGLTNVPVAVEVTGVSYGPDTLPAATTLPSGDVVGALRPGLTLRAGEAATAGPYQLAMRADGALAEYLPQTRASLGGSRARARASRAKRRSRSLYRVFGAGTAVPGSTAHIEHDGSVTVRAPGGRTVWSSRRRAGHDALGNLVLYSPARRRLMVTSGPLAGRPVAAAVKRGAVTLRAGEGIPAGGRVVAGRSSLTMGTDGDLVLARGGRTQWRARTAGHPGAYLLVRRDGAAAVASLRGHVLWSSRTGTLGHHGSRLRLRASDGQLTLQTKHDTTIWSAR
jgi:hypothetical protein